MDKGRMGDGKRVCAIVVTWQPEAGVVHALTNLRTQVDALVVVDNGSRLDLLEPIRNVRGASDFELIETGSNHGIAAAQNLGIAWAEAQGFELAMFFDQDSTVPADFVTTMVNAYDDDLRRDSIAVLAPRYRDSRLGTDLAAVRDTDGGLALAMCSGSLIPMTVLRRLGGFREELFIDYVDYEFCLRVRAEGYVLRECSGAILLHAPADPQRRKLFSLVPVTTANYSAVRRYYLGRNLVWMVRHYGLRFPTICLRFVLNFLKDGVKVLLVEEDAAKKSRASIRGVIDGLWGRMGEHSF